MAYGVSKPTVWRTIRKIENALLASGRFRLPGKKTLRQPEWQVQVLIVDATETPIQRPQKNKNSTTVVRKSATLPKLNSS